MTDTKETSDLLPCPFCGDKASTRHIRDGREVWCRGCGAAGSPKFHGPLNIPPAEDRAIAAWNRRAPTPEAAALIKAEEALDLIAKKDRLHGVTPGSNGHQSWHDGYYAVIARAALSEIKKMRGE